jgi:hypothetical protein
MAKTVGTGGGAQAARSALARKLGQRLRAREVDGAASSEIRDIRKCLPDFGAGSVSSQHLRSQPHISRLHTSSSYPLPRAPKEVEPCGC